MTIYLLDKSATAPWLPAGVRSRLETLAIQGRLAVCQMTTLELLYSAQSSADYEAIATLLGGYRVMDVTTACMDRALEVQRMLAMKGRHRLPLPDLVIAATAEVHGGTVVHNDRDYQLIADLTGQPIQNVKDWVE